jgi:NAD(P)-dependent dehydrogenase (short-subunit alcohol dehydrogenase family)
VIDLRGRDALVTGASRGIGAEVARYLAAAGARKLFLLARDAAALDAVAADVARRGAEPRVLPCDVVDPEAFAAALAAIDAVDVVVHAAGANVPQPLAEIDLGVADRLWALNVRSALQLCQQLAGRIRRGGAVVLLSSQMGHVGAERRSVYCATKHAIEGLTKALALELAPAGIRVVAVAPTFVRTPMTEPFLREPGFRERVLEQIPLGRLGEASDVAAAVLFAASPAAAMITGSSIRVDGGWTAR